MYRVLNNNHLTFKTEEEIKEEIRSLFKQKNNAIKSEEELQKITKLYVYLVDNDIK